MSSSIEFPTTDGHFWVVRDGIIIDTIFAEYKTICRVRNADVKTLSYLPAPEMTQKLMINMYKKVLTNVFGEMTFEEQCKEFFAITKLMKGDLSPSYLNCFQNCLLEINQRGGELVFGSLGFKLKGKEGYWYEFGGADYKTIKQFLKL
jgi:hypothetical protein